MSNYQNDIQDHQNFDDTGGGSGGKFVYLNLKLIGEEKGAKTCIIKQGKDGPEHRDFTGYLTNVLTPTWREAVGRVRARYEYKMLFKAKDQVDGEIKDFCLTLSSHWSSPIVSDIVNQLAGALKSPGWDKKVRISVYSKKMKSEDYVMRAKLYAGKEGPQLPTKFPWVGTKEDGEFEGVPKATTNAQGVRDFQTVSDFWHNEILLLAKHFGNDTTNATPAPGIPTTINSVPQTQQQAAQSAPATEGSVATLCIKWVAANYSALLNEKKTDTAFFDLVKQGFAKMKARGVPSDYVEAAKLAKDLALQQFIITDLDNRCFNTAGEFVQAGSSASDLDDLPF